LVCLAGCTGLLLKEEKPLLSQPLLLTRLDSFHPPPESPAVPQLETFPTSLDPFFPDQDLPSNGKGPVAGNRSPGEEEVFSLPADEEQTSGPSQGTVLSSEEAGKQIGGAEPDPPAATKGFTPFPAESKKTPADHAQLFPQNMKLSTQGKKANEGNGAETLSISIPDRVEDANTRHSDLSDSQTGFSASHFLPMKGLEPETFPVILKSPVSTLSTIFSPAFNEKKVEEYIAFFQQRGGSFSNALARSQAYEDMMKKIFREKNLPEDLFYLALIESGYNPNALSRAKAGGIWQFITKTARRFGLKVDKWIDERRDPEKSTYAAAEYLKSLYEMFNCWDLATAGYNAGEGKILRAMKKTKSQDFWEISRHQYLKKETKRYVPLFLAAVLIAKEPHKYGFSNINYHSPLVYEKVLVSPGTRLDWIAKVAETDLSELRALNPALKRERTPPGSSQFEIKLPSGKKQVFEKNLFAYNRLASNSSKKYRVRPGETLSGFAKRYRVNYQDLCELNGLSSQSKIKTGAMLLLPQ
jgi:hypothetical protein